MRNDGAVITMSGRAATNPTISGAKGERVSFRVISTERRFDEASNDWIDGDEFGVTVVCWRQLGVSVLQFVRKGDPLVIEGKLSTRKFERNGVVDYFTEVKPDHIAFDLARASGRIRRQDGAAPIEPNAAKPGDEQTEHGAAEAASAQDHAESGDPFQPAAHPAGDREPAPAL